MYSSNPYESTEDVATSHSERYRTVDLELRFRVAAILHVIEALFVLLGIISFWNPGDWHEALPWAILSEFLIVVAKGLLRGKRCARACGLIMLWVPVALCGLALCGCILLLASWPFTGAGIAHGLALAALIPLSLSGAFSLATIQSLQIGYERRPSS